jgi:hypothetical protein
MGPIGDCNDNALIKALWSRMQIELLDTHRWTTRVELANAIFGYSEIFHNPTGATPLSACGHQSNTNSRHQHHTGGVNAGKGRLTSVRPGPRRGDSARELAEAGRARAARPAAE